MAEGLEFLRMCSIIYMIVMDIYDLLRGWQEDGIDDTMTVTYSTSTAALVVVHEADNTQSAHTIPAAPTAYRYQEIGVLYKILGVDDDTPVESNRK